LTPHSLVASLEEARKMGGAHHPLLGVFGVMSAKNTVVNIMILSTFLSFLIYRRAREVSMHLKGNAGAEFTRTIEKDILPRLRKQTGFADELTFLNPNGKDAVAISLWDRKENADAYSRDTYPEVLKNLATVVEGTPEVRAYEVANSTFHKIAAQS